MNRFLPAIFPLGALLLGAAAFDKADPKLLARNGAAMAVLAYTLAVLESPLTR